MGEASIDMTIHSTTAHVRLDIGDGVIVTSSITSDLQQIKRS